MRAVGHTWVVGVGDYLKSQHSQYTRCCEWLATLPPAQADCLGELIASRACRVLEDYVQECGGLKRWANRLYAHRITDDVASWSE
jgi:hypothetical protein